MELSHSRWTVNRFIETVSDRRARVAPGSTSTRCQLMPRDWLLLRPLATQRDRAVALAACDEAADAFWGPSAVTSMYASSAPTGAIIILSDGAVLLTARLASSRWIASRIHALHF